MPFKTNTTLINFPFEFYFREPWTNLQALLCVIVFDTWNSFHLVVEMNKKRIFQALQQSFSNYEILGATINLA